MPIDIKDLRPEAGGDPDFWRENQRKRFLPPEQVDVVLALDARQRTLAHEIDVQRTAKNTVQAKITAAMKGLGKRRKELSKEEFAAAKEALQAELAPSLEEKVRLEAAVPALTKELEQVRRQRKKELGKMGNFLDESVPVSNDEEKHSVEVEVWGTPRKEEGLLKHSDILWMIDGYEPERGVGVAGHRAYFLKGNGLLLNMALVQYGTHFLMKRQYTMLQPPYFMNKDVMDGVAQLEEYDEALYKVTGEEGDDKYLIATSEQPICAYHKDEIIGQSQLPKRYGGISTCFRKEAGSHGRDTWGIFRVHQFEKVEQFVVCEPSKSEAMQEEMIGTAKEFYQSLGLAYHVINIVSGELNNAAAKKLDLEAWFPSYDAYRELVSCSNCTDYQSRGMNIRLPAKDGDLRTHYVHMLNATLVATTRTLCCILENYQTPEGVRVPEVLVPFMGGITFLPFTRAKPENLTQAKMDRAAARKANKKAGGKKAGGKQAGGKKAGGKKAGGKKTGAGGAGAGAGAAAPATAAVATAAAPAPQSAAPPAPQTSESS